MRTLCIVTGVLIVIAEAAAAQVLLPLPTLPARRAAIENVWVEPTPLTSSTETTCRVAVTGTVCLDRVEKTRLGSSFRLRLFWIDHPVVTTTTTAEHTESLGTLSAGLYTLMVQSMHQGRLVDAKQVMFRVEEASTQPSTPNYIDDVWIVPEHPIAAEPVTLHVSGEWATPGYTLTGLATMMINNRITVKMYWRTPSGNVPQVVTPYEEEIEFPSLSEDTYRVTILCYRNNWLVDSAQLTFDVAPADDLEPE